MGRNEDVHPNDTPLRFTSAENAIYIQAVKRNTVTPVEALHEGVYVDGMWGGKYEMHYRADMALCGAYYRIEQNTKIVDAMYRKSGLFRYKWDTVRHGDKSTYGEKLLERVSENYEVMCQNELHKDKRIKNIIVSIDTTNIDTIHNSINALSPDVKESLFLFLLAEDKFRKTPHLSPNAASLLLAVRRVATLPRAKKLCDYVYCSQARIVQESGLSLATVKRYLNTYAYAGVFQKHIERVGMKKTLLYIKLSDELLALDGDAVVNAYLR